jgi:hypothetical protein
MKHFAISTILALFTVLFSSCADKEQAKPGPVSDSTQLPWNMPQKGQGGGQFSMMPQNQYRR